MHWPSKYSGVALSLEIQHIAYKSWSRGWQWEITTGYIIRGIPHSESSFSGLAPSSQKWHPRSSVPDSSRWPPSLCASVAGTEPAVAEGGFLPRWDTCHRLSMASLLSDAALKTGCLHHHFLLLLLQWAWKKYSHIDLPVIRTSKWQLQSRLSYTG